MNIQRTASKLSQNTANPHWQNGKSASLGNSSTMAEAFYLRTIDRQAIQTIDQAASHPRRFIKVVKTGSAVPGDRNN